MKYRACSGDTIVRLCSTGVPSGADAVPSRQIAGVDVRSPRRRASRPPGTTAEMVSRVRAMATPYRRPRTSYNDFDGEILIQQPGETLRRQVGLLQQVGHLVRAADALEVVDRGTRRDRERCGDSGCRGLPPRGHNGRVRLQAAGAHLVDKAGARRNVPDDRGPADERASAAGTFQASLMGELREGSPDGDEAAPVALHQRALRGELIARAPDPVVEGRAQVEVDLVMQRDRSGFEAEPRHASRRARCSWPARDGAGRVAHCTVHVH